MQIFLNKISRGKKLTYKEAKSAMEVICSEEASHEQTAAFLAILHTRGETKEELLGFISYLKERSTNIQINNPVIDTCGTGGDYANTFNISTASALLIASTGIKVAKHGGRFVSSQCGSADVLEALGIYPQKDAILALQVLEKTGFLFLLASHFNSVFQYVRLLRKKLGIRTCFNMIGPLLNPIDVKSQVLGVFSKRLLKPMAELLYDLGKEEAIVVHSRDGLDEFSINAPSDVAHLKSGLITYYAVKPEELPVKKAPITAIQGGNAHFNAAIIEGIFNGAEDAYLDSILINSAAGLMISGVADTFSEGIIIAKEAILKGQAKKFLAYLQQFHSGESHD